MEQELTLDPVQTCARLTLLEELLAHAFAEAIGHMTGDSRNAFAASFIDSLRYSMHFQTDDGDTMFRVQSATVQHAEAFFARVERKLAGAA